MKFYVFFDKLQYFLQMYTSLYLLTSAVHVYTITFVL